MSDNDKKTIDEMHRVIQEDADLERRKHELAKIKLAVEETKFNALLERDKENAKHLETAKNIDFTSMSVEQIQKIQKDNEDYLVASNDNLRFMYYKTPEGEVVDLFKKLVPLYRKNLILILGKTGKGKSTSVTNIMWSVLNQISPKTGKKCTVTHITNEEPAMVAYNKLTCLGKGWNYADHEKFTKEQRSILNQAVLHWSKYLTVIDNEFKGGKDITKSIEGIRAIFENMIATNNFPDLITLDFYQYVANSKKFPTMEKFRILEMLSEDLNNWKDVIPCPIVVMAQLHPDNEDDGDPDIERRIKGSKSIMVPATMVMELITEPKEFLTRCLFHKNRLNGASVGEEVKLGFDMGRFVKYDDAFKEKVRKIHAHAMDVACGLPDVKKEE